MKTLIGGAVASVLGIIGLAVWFKPFLNILAGVLPIVLLLAGGLALYLGFDELKDSWRKDEGVEATDEVDPQKRIEELEKEVAALKK